MDNSILHRDGEAKEEEAVMAVVALLGVLHRMDTHKVVMVVVVVVVEVAVVAVVVDQCVTAILETIDTRLMVSSIY